MTLGLTADCDRFFGWRKDQIADHSFCLAHINALSFGFVVDGHCKLSSGVFL